MPDAPSGAKLHYRLNQIDHDGSFTYSPTAEVMLPARETAAFLSAHPTVTGGEITVTARPEKAGMIRLSVYDALGRKAAVLYEGECAAEGRSFRFTLDGLSAGAYRLMLESGGTILRRAFVNLER